MVGAISAQNAGSFYNKIDKDALKTAMKGATDPLEMLKENDDKFISSCSDGQDDGKLSFKEKASAFGRGVINHFTEGFRNLKKLVVEHPVESLLVAGGCLAVGAIAISVLGAPLVLGALAVGGVVMGVKGMISCGKEMISSFHILTFQ